MHPAVFSRRMRELALAGVGALVPLALALAITLSVPAPNILLLLGIGLGVVALVGLVASPRIEVTVMIVALYVGLLDGPVKLGIGGHNTVTAVRDVLIGAVCAGALMRMFAKRQRLVMPPLSALVLAYVAVVLTEALNPHTQGFTKSIGGFRQLLEWVPFFFFGYAVMRSKARFRRMFMVLGVIALANGIVGAYQTRLSPQSLATWGPGYSEVALGIKGGLSGRTFVSEGEAHVRPPALGTDSGFGGDVAIVSLPATMALLAIGGLRRRWPVLLCFFGAIVGAATCGGRLQLIGTVLGALAFVALASWGIAARGRRALRPLITLLCVILLVIPAGALLVSALGRGTFARYEKILNGSNGDNKTASLTHIPEQLAKSPFGVGLGVAGGAAGFGNSSAASSEVQEVHNPDAETQYNFLADEAGMLGIALWLALSGRLIYLVLRRLRRIQDTELLLSLAAMFSSFLAVTAVGFFGPTLTSGACGPFVWFFAGTVAYWFLGPGRAELFPGRDARAGLAAQAAAGAPA